MFKKDKLFEKLPWTGAAEDDIAASIRAGTCPHSLLVTGPAGTGRRDLALRIAGHWLGADAVRASDAGGEALLEPAHPDFRAVEPLTDEKTGKEKTGIGIDQVRDDLIPFLSLTSHAGGGRAVVLWPAETMTREAANSLLKTLEEPPPGALLVLVADALERLPATIVSRCQRIRVSPPPATMAHAWLQSQAPGEDFTTLLEFCGGAPLAALELHDQDFAEFANGFLASLDRLEQGETSPVEVAAACRGSEALALRLLEWRLTERIRRAAEQPEGLGSAAEAGFSQLGQIRELRRVIHPPFNAELGLAALLLNWYGGLDRRQE